MLSSLLLSIAADESVVLFLLVGLSVGLVTKFAFKHYKITIPYSVVVLIIGILLGLIQLIHNNDFTFSENVVGNVNPDMILIIFLPALIFEGAYNIHFYVVTQTIVSSILLAGPGVVISTILTGILSHYTFSGYNWDWYACFMFVCKMTHVQQRYTRDITLDYIMHLLT